MDNDLLTLWTRAIFLTETEIRDVIDELQTTREDLRAALDDDEAEANKIRAKLCAIGDQLASISEDCLS